MRIWLFTVEGHWNNFTWHVRCKWLLGKHLFRPRYTRHRITLGTLWYFRLQWRHVNERITLLLYSGAILFSFCTTVYLVTNSVKTAVAEFWMRRKLGRDCSIAQSADGFVRNGRKWSVNRDDTSIEVRGIRCLYISRMHSSMQRLTADVSGVVSHVSGFCGTSFFTREKPYIHKIRSENSVPALQ